MIANGAVRRSLSAGLVCGLLVWQVGGSAQTGVAAPVIGIATAQNSSALVRFSPALGSAAEITHYTVMSTPGGQSVRGTTSPLVVTGLTNGQRYTFTVRAHAATVASTASQPSNPVTPAARTPTPLDLDITWVLPSWDRLISAPPDEMSAMVRRLRTEIGDGPRARIGLSVFVQLTMPEWNIDTTDRAALRAALAGAIAPVDAAIARARPHKLPIGISLLTPIREREDGVQRAAQAEDRRNVQWYHDHEVATGWITYSQYARKLRRIQEAYVREFGRMLAERMIADPDILVAVTGDGETEMTYERFRDIVTPKDLSQRSWADYSPFAVAEFRDWLRAGGLYAAGQSLAGQAYAQSARYAGDASPAIDTNRDGRTLNGDFGTTFTTWDIKHFPWELTDAETARAISPVGFVPRTSTTGGFDAPRPAPATVLETTGPFWDAWIRFRQEMIFRYNRDVARWITESTDAASGGVPFERWYSAQIPTDMLFAWPPADMGVRLLTSGSAHWTADIWPYGGMGVTSYNVNLAGAGGNGPFSKTTVHVVPRAALRSHRWGIVEWNPGDPWSPDPTVYREDNAIVARHYPSLLMPYKVNTEHYRVFDSGFVVALRELMAVLAPRSTRPAPRAVPIGSVDTPAQNAAIADPVIALTGWALDDVGIERVEVFRDCLPFEAAQRPSPCVEVLGQPLMYLGVATRVDGARPDVAKIHASLPEANLAGWGFVIPAAQLPDVARSRETGGRGPVAFSVIALDREGQRTLLGGAPRRVTVGGS